MKPLLLILLFFLTTSACMSGGGDDGDSVPQTNSTTTTSTTTSTTSETDPEPEATTTTTTLEPNDVDTTTLQPENPGNSTTVATTNSSTTSTTMEPTTSSTTVATTTTTEPGNIIFDPHNNSVTEIVDFNNASLPGNWSMSNMDVTEIDANMHGYVLIPSFFINQSDFGSLNYHFEVEDNGQFELEFEMKVENFNESAEDDKNPQLFVELLHLQDQEDAEKRAFGTFESIGHAAVRKTAIIKDSEGNIAAQKRNVNDDDEGWRPSTQGSNTLSYSLFKSTKYNKYFATHSHWIHIRFVMKHKLPRGKYQLMFKARRGLNEAQIVALDNINLKTSSTMKTDDEIPETTTTTTTTTTTVTTTTESSTTMTTSTTTTTEVVSNCSTQAPIQGPPDPSVSGTMNATTEAFVLIVLVAISVALAGLAFKHHQLRAKLREYEVTRDGQTYDNPVFSGQHTSAERYGQIQIP